MRARGRDESFRKDDSPEVLDGNSIAVCQMRNFTRFDTKICTALRLRLRYPSCRGYGKLPQVVCWMPQSPWGRFSDGLAVPCPRTSCRRSSKVSSRSRRASARIHSEQRIGGNLRQVENILYGFLFRLKPERCRRGAGTNLLGLLFL